MTQILLDLTPPEPKPARRRVREASVAQYADAREAFEGRKADVLRWLAHYCNARNEWPTGAELAEFARMDHANEKPGVSWDWLLLYVRRGMSDLQKTGVVERVPDGVRPCRVLGGHRVNTWRVTPAGRDS